MIELGRRRVTAEELLALPAIARDAGVLDVRDVAGAEDLDLHLGDFAEDVVMLSPLAGTKALHKELRGARVELVLIGTDRAPDTPEAREIRRLWPRLLPDRTQSKAEVFRIALESRGAAETKVARMLGVSPATVAMAAHARWHRSLTAHRDALAVQVLSISGPDRVVVYTLRQLQARRGHFTRRLVNELRPLLKHVSAKRRTRG